MLAQASSDTLANTKTQQNLISLCAMWKNKRYFIKTFLTFHLYEARIAVEQQYPNILPLGTLSKINFPLPTHFHQYRKYFHSMEKKLCEWESNIYFWLLMTFYLIVISEWYQRNLTPSSKWHKSCLTLVSAHITLSYGN